MRQSNWTVWHLGLLVPWVVAVVPARLPFRDNSYLWHVKLGELQAANAAVSTSDPFSFTAAGQPWRSQSWLPELLYWRVDEFAGLAGAGWLTAVVGVAVFLLLGLLVYRISRSLVVTAGLGVLTSILFSVFLNPRPAILALALFALLVLTAEDRRLAWAGPLVVWVWAAVHASFPVGLLFLGLRAASQRFTGPTIRTLLAAALVPLLTAHGSGLFEFLFQFANQRDALAFLAEWRLPDVFEPPYFILIAGIVILIAVASQGRLVREDWWTLIPFLVLLFSARRSVPMAWIALLPAMARLRPRVGSLTPMAAVPAAATGLLILLFPFFVSGGSDVDLERFPLAVYQAISSERVFHDDVVGGWLIYTQGPNRQVYIDDRAELYGAESFARMQAIMLGSPVWREEFDRYGIEEALLPVGSILGEELRDDGWSEVISSAGFVVMRTVSD